MTTGQSYVGGDSHATATEHIEPTAPISKPKRAKVDLGIDLDLLTHSGDGTSQTETLIWALETHRDYHFREYTKALTSADYLGAHRAKRELDNLNSIMLSVATKAVYQAEENYWANNGKASRDGFTHEREVEHVRAFLREYTRIDADSADIG